MKFLGSMVSSLTGVVLIEKIAYSRHIFGEINIPPSVSIQKNILEPTESMVWTLAV